MWEARACVSFFLAVFSQDQTLCDYEKLGRSKQHLDDHGKLV